MIKVKAVLFDFIGTTVKESGGDVISTCFANAFQSEGIAIDHDLLTRHRGKDKREMIRTLLTAGNYPASFETRIYDTFKTNVQATVSDFSANDGAIEIFKYLADRGIAIGVGTGLERDVMEKIVAHLRWPMELFQYVGIGNELPRQRPHPDMIWDMMAKLKIERRDEFLKVGDTTADIEEGKNAGVKTVAILSGTQPESALRKAGPDFLISNLMDLQDIIR